MLPFQIWLFMHELSNQVKTQDLPNAFFKNGFCTFPSFCVDVPGTKSMKVLINKPPNIYDIPGFEYVLNEYC